MIVVAPCVSCGHGADEHRLEGVSVDGAPAATLEAAAPIIEASDVSRALVGPFRCVADGCGCRDFVDEPLVRKKRP